MNPTKRTLTVLGLSATVVLLPTLALGHPAGFDPHNACLAPGAFPGPFTPGPTVIGTWGYVDFVGTLPCPGFTPPWGDDSAAACLLPPFTGPIPGMYCGPLVLPFLSTTCSWAPLVNTVPTGLVIGFDEFPYDGTVNLVTGGEGPAVGPFPPGAWTVVNTNALPARVIAYPTDLSTPGVPITAGADTNAVICV